MSELRKIKDVTIFNDGSYNTFPSAITLKDGRVMVGFRSAPNWLRFGITTHVDPASKAVYVISEDNGNTWSSKSGIIYDDYLYGVQDPCLNLLKDGTILATFFMWKAFSRNDIIPRPRDRKMGDDKKARLDKVYTIRSKDNGKTWDQPVPVDCFEESTMGMRGIGTELDNGDILLPIYGSESDKEASEVVVLRTRDQGLTWSVESRIRSEAYNLEEPSIIRTKSGKIVAFIRTSPFGDTKEGLEKTKAHPLMTCQSFDEGRTWDKLEQRDIFSPSPFHPLGLDNGKILVSYGYRHEPYGIRAFILDGECDNFEGIKEHVLLDDGLGGDIGYTSSTQTKNGDVLITYYYYRQDGTRYIGGTLCEIR